MAMVSSLTCSMFQGCPLPLLNFGYSHQALAGMVSTLAWSTFQMMLAYIDEAGYITSRGGCAYQPNIVWLGQYVGVVSVESMFCWGIWAILLADSGGFNRSAHKWRWHGLASKSGFSIFSRFIGNQVSADASTWPSSSGFRFPPLSSDRTHTTKRFWFDDIRVLSS